MATLIDGYDDFPNFSGIGDAYNFVGQSFYNTTAITLDNVQFVLRKSGTIPSEFLTSAYVYAHSGTFGTSSIPTGSPLATSNSRDPNEFSTAPSADWEEFTFSGANRILLQADSSYCVVLFNTYYNEGNYVQYGYRGSGGSHEGNAFTSLDGSSWTAGVAGEETTFSVYGINVYSMATTVGQFVLTGINTTFKYGKTLVASVGQFVLTGKTVNLLRPIIRMATSVGQFVLTGAQIAVSIVYKISLDWINQSQSGDSSITNQTKNSVSMTNSSKNSSVMVNASKNSSSMVNTSKNNETFTNQRKST